MKIEFPLVLKTPKNPAHVRHSEAIAVLHGPILDSGHAIAQRPSCGDFEGATRRALEEQP